MLGAMRKIIIQKLLVLLTMALVSGGCSSESPEEEAPPKALPSEMRAAIINTIIAQQQRAHDAPDRTGILAEKNLYSVFGEEIIIRDFFQDRKGGFFVDVGCAWPIASSNTYYLEKHLDWTGIGIDALDDFAAAWAEKRPKSKFFNFLVTDRSGGTGVFFKSPGLGLSSTNRDFAAGKTFGESMETKKIEVPMIALDDLLEREGIEKIDLLSMDIERHETKALAGFDIGRFQPELLVIEGQNRAVAEYFSEHGYEQIQRYIPFDYVNRYYRRKQAATPPANLQ